MAYATLTNLYSVYNQDAIATLAPSLEPTADPGDVDEDKANAALDRASDLIDSYLARRYEVPVTPTPDQLIGPNCEIAYYLLATTGNSTGATEQDRQRYEDAIAWLTSINKGNAVLVDATEVSTSASSADLPMSLPSSTNTATVFTRVSTWRL